MAVNAPIAADARRRSRSCARCTRERAAVIGQPKPASDLFVRRVFQVVVSKNLAIGRAQGPQHVDEDSPRFGPFQVLVGTPSGIGKVG